MQDNMAYLVNSRKWNLLGGHHAANGSYKDSMEVIDSRSGDETELPLSALSTDKSFSSDSDNEGRKRSLDEGAPLIEKEISADIGADAAASLDSVSNEPLTKKVKVEIETKSSPSVDEVLPSADQASPVKEASTETPTANETPAKEAPTAKDASNIKQEAPTVKKETPPAPKKKLHNKKKVDKEKEKEKEKDEPFDSSNEDIAKQYKKFKNAPKYNLNSEEVFCICRKPDHDGLLMISCDGCNEWFHFTCMKLNVQYQNLIAKFYCKFCSWKDVGFTQWKRKCRVETCFESIAAEGNSKYCSEKCGLEYIKDKLLGKERPLLIEKETDKALHVLTEPEIKSILIYSTSNGATDDEQYRHLKVLGSKLPELAEVVEYQSDPLIVEKFPEGLRAEIEQFTTRMTKLQSLVKVYMGKLEVLLKLREKLKIINERLQERDQSDNKPDETSTASNSSKSRKGKSSKVKKIEICGYDKIFSLEEDEWIRYAESSKEVISALVDNPSLSYSSIHEDLRRQIDDLVDFYHTKEDEETWFNNSICINDKRKCARHGGWWSLVQDEISNRIDQFHTDMRAVERERLAVLRDYTILVFEGEAKLAENEKLTGDEKLARNDSNLAEKLSGNDGQLVIGA